MAFNPNSLNTETPIKGSFVYVNYGEAEDYDKVIANGVEVKDKIVLVKYGGKTLNRIRCTLPSSTRPRQWCLSLKV